MDPQRVLALCREHSTAEAAEDAEGVLATLVDEPVFEFFPLRLRITGRANIEAFYYTQYPLFAARVTGFEVLNEWANENAALQEYVVDITDEDGSAKRYNVMSMMPGDGDTQLLTGERLYCDEGFVRALLGPLFALAEPIA